ncbi:MAG: hypothetical protein MJK15_01850 [Colwellia sp.]|nr:hypothetical protein [Colwellia sp.]
MTKPTPTPEHNSNVKLISGKPYSIEAERELLDHLRHRHSVLFATAVAGFTAEPLDSIVPILSMSPEQMKAALRNDNHEESPSEHSRAAIIINALHEITTTALKQSILASLHIVNPELLDVVAAHLALIKSTDNDTKLATLIYEQQHGIKIRVGRPFKGIFDAEYPIQQKFDAKVEVDTRKAQEWAEFRAQEYCGPHDD